MTTENSKEEITFSSRFYKHLKTYYMMFGIGGLIIACTIIVSIIIGIITFNVIIPIAQSIPPLGYAIIGVVSLPAILALIHTFFEIDCSGETKNKKYPRFEVEIQKTAYDYSWVFLKAYSSPWVGADWIATKTPNNNEAQSVANSLLENADKIYALYKNKPSGTFTKPTRNNESELIKEINDLKQKVDELSKNKSDSKTKPMSELERQNKENNSTIEI
jgi:hypothetical protein